MADTVSMRLPDDVVEEARTWGQILGHRTPGEALAAAWEMYLENHAEEIAEDFEREARKLRERRSR